MEASWRSVLDSPRELELRAPDAVPWTEVWRLDVSPIWHADVEGIPMVHQPDAAERSREWRPWPGEQVTVKIRRPAPVSGPTLTIDSTSLDTRPGLRASDFTLALSLRSSRGGRHEIELPEGAELLSVVIDGVTQPIRPEGRSVAIPIVPGRRTATLGWREPRGVEPSFVTSRVDVRAPSVNASTRMLMPADRWVLWVSGGGMGPAVLFWSYLVVIAVVAAGLSRVRSTPLRGRHWFLLGLGLTQVPVWSSALIAGWLLALGWRRERGASADDASFNWMQVVLAIWTFCALAALFAAIEHGLLGLPEMQIAGYGSSAYDLRWYHDRTAPVLPQVKVVSVPLLFYRGAMLLWALWIAWSLLGWLRWGWTAFNEGGFWRSTGWKWQRPRPAPAPAATPAPPAT
jgi:hypothetical protein